VNFKVNNFYINNSGENKMGAAYSAYGEATHNNIIGNLKGKKQLGDLGIDRMLLRRENVLEFCINMTSGII